MPVRGKNEKLSKFISRCVPIVMKENNKLTREQALGKCYGMGRNRWKPKKKK